MNETIRRLIESWCERKEYKPLSIVLPVWIGNNGLTDGWAMLREALKHAYAMCSEIPLAERDALKEAYIEIDMALRDR